MVTTHFRSLQSLMSSPKVKSEWSFTLGPPPSSPQYAIIASVGAVLPLWKYLGRIVRNVLQIFKLGLLHGLDTDFLFAAVI